MKKRELYDALIGDGYVLPQWTSKAITTKYLNAVENDKCVRFKSDQTIEGVVLTIQKYELLGELRRCNAVLGFEEHELPDHNWMVQALYVLNPTHPLFRSHSALVEATFDYLESKNDDNNTRMKRHHSIFKRCEARVISANKKSRRSKEIKKLQRLLEKFKKKYPFLTIREEWLNLR